MSPSRRSARRRAERTSPCARSVRRWWETRFGARPTSQARSHTQLPTLIEGSASVSAPSWPHQESACAGTACARSWPASARRHIDAQHVARLSTASVDPPPARRRPSRTNATCCVDTQRVPGRRCGRSGRAVNVRPYPPATPVPGGSGRREDQHQTRHPHVCVLDAPEPVTGDVPAPAATAQRASAARCHRPRPAGRPAPRPGPPRRASGR
jgi:hypothetical protein